MYDEDHDTIIVSAMKRHGDAVFKFWRDLSDAPLVGLNHPVGRRILKELKQCRKLVLKEGVWYRAASKSDYTRSLTPRHLVRDGRYNSGGQPCLYMASSDKCAVAECTARSDNREAFVQRFSVPQIENVLDLRQGPIEDDLVCSEPPCDFEPTYGFFLTAVIFSGLLMQRDEHHLSEEQFKESQHRAMYVLPRFIADCARVCGFSGLVYKSSRLHGVNVALFELPPIEFVEDPYWLALTNDDLLCAPSVQEWWY